MYHVIVGLNAIARSIPRKSHARRSVQPTICRSRSGFGGVSSSSLPFADAAPVEKALESTETKQFYNPVQRQLIQKCRELHASIMPLNEKVGSGRCFPVSTPFLANCLDTLHIRCFIFDSLPTFHIRANVSCMVRWHHIRIVARHSPLCCW